MKKLWLNWLKVNSRQRPYYTQDIVAFENGQYVLKNRISPNMERKILNILKSSNQEQYQDFWNKYLPAEREVS